MPKIIVQADHRHSDGAQITLTERIDATHLSDSHYAAQLLERLRWAAADAEALAPAPAGAALD